MTVSELLTVLDRASYGTFRVVGGILAAVVLGAAAHEVWTRRQARKHACSLEGARMIGALRREGYRMYPVDDDEWAEYARAHGLDDGDGLTRDWRWRS